MTLHVAVSGLVLAGSLALPFGAAQASAPMASFGTDGTQWIARGGGGRAGGGGGRVGGGGSRVGAGSGPRAQSGFNTAGSGLNRGSAKPSGGWSNRVSNDRIAPSMDRSAVNRGSRALGSGDLGSRDLKLSNRDVTRNVNRNVSRDINRDWGRNINVADVNLRPGWARPGWGVARPWNYGWYGGWTTPAWGWWGARAAAWGVGTLATAAMINNAVDTAISDQATYIVVPNTDYQLLYGTVQPTSGSGVAFDVTVNGSTYSLTADCNSGYINGREPSSAQEAELLNAACQVAYGSV